jgi:hypothetical protein
MSVVHEMLKAIHREASTTDLAATNTLNGTLLCCSSQHSIPVIAPKTCRRHVKLTVEDSSVTRASFSQEPPEPLPIVGTF